MDDTFSSNENPNHEAPPGGKSTTTPNEEGGGEARLASTSRRRDATSLPAPQGEPQRADAPDGEPERWLSGDTPLVVDLSPDGLWIAFTHGRNPKTLRAYQQDFKDLQQFLGLANIAEVCGFLVRKSQTEINAVTLSYRHALQQKKLSPATQNRRIASLRSLLKLARFVGVTDTTIELKPVPQEKYRDTSGPGREGFLQMLAILEEKLTTKALRDRAILRLLYDLALRRFEVVSLDLRHYDPKRGTLSILGKGRQHRQTLQLPAQTRAAIDAWIEKRGREAGALFTNLDPARKGDGRLTDDGLYLMIKELGKKIGLEVRPHGLRHAAITDALDATQGNVRAVQRFSRHKDLRILTQYDDARQDMASEISRLVASRGTPQE
jgi:integrase/recombinase XerC